MKLSSFEGKRVQITDKLGEVFEGICKHNSRDYNDSEFGRNDESLQILYYNFYKHMIKDVKEIDNYTSDHSKLEEYILEDGVSGIEEVLESEEDEMIIRFLRYCNKTPNDIDFLEFLPYLENIRNNSDNLELIKVVDETIDKIDKN